MKPLTQNAVQLGLAIIFGMINFLLTGHILNGILLGVVLGLVFSWLIIIFRDFIN